MRLPVVPTLWSEPLRIAATLMMLLALATGLPKVGRCQFSFSPSICIEPRDIDQHKPDIACANDGTIFIVWVSLDSAQIRISKSTDGGESFLPSRAAVSLNLLTATPKAAVDDSGNPMIAWPGADSGGRWIKFTRSTDKGTTFLPPVAVDSTHTWMQISAAIAVDLSGNPHISWVYDAGPPSEMDVYYSRSTDKGFTFLPPVVVDSSALEQREASITVDMNGNPFAAYRHGAPLDQREVYVTRSTDGGFSFAQKRLAEPFDSYCAFPLIAASNRDEIMLVWSDYFFAPTATVFFTKSTDGGLTFEYPRAVDSTGNLQLCSGLAIDSAGCPAVAWLESESTSTWALVAYSSDQGMTFFSPQPVDTCTTAIYSEPYICFNNEGNILVTWKDQRPGTGRRIRFSKGTVTGLTEHVDHPKRLRPRVEAYPNPSTGLVHVYYSDYGGSDFSVAIYDIAGRLVEILGGESCVRADGKSLIVIGGPNHRLKAGVYFLVVSDEFSGEEVREILKVILLR